MKKYNKEWDSYYDEEKDIWLESQCQYEDCEFCTDRPTKPSECKTSNHDQKKISEDKGNTSPSPPLRKKRQPIEGGCIGDSLAPSDTPQDCSGQANVAAKEDTNNSVLPADLNLLQKVEDLVILEDKKLLEELGSK